MGAGGIIILIAALLVRLLNPGRLLLLAGGIASIWGGNYLMHRNDALKATAVKTTGTVVRLDERGTADDASYYTVATYRTSAGATGEVTSSVGSNPASNRVGDTVTVYYNPKSPSDAIIDSSIDNLMPAIVVVIGGVIVLATLVSTKPST
jgi:hypothetical protein